MRVYRVDLGTGSPSSAAPAAPSPPDKAAVAVLPFDNLSGDPEQAYFSDGITEDVITELSRFRELLVIARNSSFAFRGKAVDVREIGRALGADYVVEGSVRRAGARVRITAQLIDAATGAHLWAERYDRPLEDVFAIQDEIARGIVATVAARVLEEREIAARRRPPRDMRAYDLFLQGYRLSDTYTPEAQAQARELFERARELDPTFARAYTGWPSTTSSRHRCRDRCAARRGPRPAGGPAACGAGAGARPQRRAHPLHAGLHVPDLVGLRPRRAPPRPGAGR